MKNLLLATSCVLLMGANAFAQSQQAVKALEAAGDAATATRATTTGAVKPGTIGSGKTSSLTGRDAVTTQRASGASSSLSASAANATGVSAKSNVKAPAKAIQAAGPMCSPAVMAKRSLSFQATLKDSPKFVSATCEEDLSTGAQEVSIKVMKAVQAARTGTELNAAANVIAKERGISFDEARTAAIGVMCKTAGHNPCLAVSDASICRQ